VTSGKRQIWETLTATRTRKRTLILVALAVAFIVGALIIGVSDNIPGLILCFIAVTLIFVACVHTWRQTKKFLILMGASLAGFFLFVILHNVFYGLATFTSDIPVVSHFMEFSHVAFFCIALFICPSGFLIGAVGSIYFAISKLRAKQSQQGVQ